MGTIVSIVFSSTGFRMTFETSLQGTEASQKNVFLAIRGAACIFRKADAIELLLRCYHAC